MVVRRLLSATVVRLATFSIGFSAVFTPDILAGNVPSTDRVRVAGMQSEQDYLPTYRRRTEALSFPRIDLVKADGSKVALTTLLGGQQPIILDFVFTTCSNFCPILSATFAAVERKLAGEQIQPHLISISIDPEHDTPDRLLQYSKRFNAGANWDFFTGDYSDIVAVQRAFGAFRGDKTGHQQLIFMRASTDSNWLRIEGFASAEDLVREYRIMNGE